jgi:hypothetical protein
VIGGKKDKQSIFQSTILEIRKNKISQIKNIENSYIVSDEIEYGTGNKIPLWQFGLMY